jgi:hypothetical protein
MRRDQLGQRHAKYRRVLAVKQGLTSATSRSACNRNNSVVILQSPVKRALWLHSLLDQDRDTKSTNMFTTPNWIHCR